MRKSVCNLVKLVTISPISSMSRSKKGIKIELESDSINPITSNVESSENIKWEPVNDWKLIYENIKKMRSEFPAPVDTMGCERTMEDDVEPKVRRFQTLLSLMLSSQTKDQVTFAAMERLKGGREKLTLQKIIDMEEKELGELIKPVGFWKKKAMYIKKTANILREKYEDDIPSTIEGLCSLPGVGQKMGYICLNVAFGLNAGIGVDTHVHRISNRLKWTGGKETKTPEKTREALESWLPKEIWQEFNVLLVGFGQTICAPVKPKCSECLNQKICPFAKSNKGKKVSKSKKKKDDVSSDEESD